MRTLLLSAFLLLPACGDKESTPTDDTGGGGESGGESGGDSGGDSGTGGDDTGDPSSACPEDVVTFVGSDGSNKDVTDFFTSGDYLTLAVPGTLEVCPGTWFARVLLRADVDVVGLGDKPKDTILSGGESGTIIDIAGPDITVNVSNLRLDRGAGLDVEHNSGGGGIYCEQEATLTVTDVIFTDNFANDGSAIYTRDCVVDITATVMKDNVSEDDGGAATFWSSTVTMDDVRIENNVALDGGAMAMFNSDFTGSNMNIEGNTGTHFGGGIWAYDSDFSLTDSTIVSNELVGSDYGGGLLMYGTGYLEDVAFTGNVAPKGAGIFVYYEADLEVVSCDFADNDPDDIYVADYSSAGGYAMTDVGSDFSMTCADSECSD